jgi:hypothetical protein
MRTWSRCLVATNEVPSASRHSRRLDPRLAVDRLRRAFLQFIQAFRSHGNSASPGSRSKNFQGLAVTWTLIGLVASAITWQMSCQATQVFSNARKPVSILKPMYLVVLASLGCISFDILEAWYTRMFQELHMLSSDGAKHRNPRTFPIDSFAQDRVCTFVRAEYGYPKRSPSTTSFFNFPLYFPSTNCLRPLQHWDRGFESHLGMDVCVCSVCVFSVST